VEQLQHPQAAVYLDEGSDGRVAEAGIGVARERHQLGPGDRAAHVGLEQRDRDLGERLAGEAGDGLGRNPRPGLRDIEPTVARKPGQQGGLEGQLRRFASGAYVLQRLETLEVRGR
jgi:hypothetical protein